MNKKEQIKLQIKAYLFFIVVGLLIFFIFIKPIIGGLVNDYKHDREIITNREWKEFQEWEQKQEQKEWENQEVNH
ncbi:Uncharacterised protein [[Flavobacterium] thermophilum]|nr:Uncharacterised protein [[Flavobacterium] thermophilum]